MGNNSGERKGINDIRAFIVHFRTYVDFVMLIHVYPGVEPMEGLERGLKHPLLPGPTPPTPHPHPPRGQSKQSSLFCSRCHQNKDELKIVTGDEPCRLYQGDHCERPKILLREIGDKAPEENNSGPRKH